MFRQGQIRRVPQSIDLDWYPTARKEHLVVCRIIQGKARDASVSAQTPSNGLQPLCDGWNV